MERIIIRFLLFSFLLCFFQLPSPASAEEGYQLAPGDIISLTIFAGGKEQANTEVTVSEQGIVSVPFLGDIQAENATLAEVAKKIKEELARDYFVNPIVNVGVKEYRSKKAHSKVYVLGRVKNPTAYDYQEGLTALNACILAGGFDPFAAPKRATITRQTGGKEEVIKINLEKVRDGKEPDPLLKPGDRIFIPETRL